MGVEQKTAQVAFLRKTLENQSETAAEKLGRPAIRTVLSGLFDYGSFVELGVFCKEPQGEYSEGVVTGYGSVDGRLVFVWAQDATVLHGGMGRAQAEKISRLIELAAKAGAPVVSVMDSLGARIAEGLDSLAAYGRITESLFAASGVVPQIAIITGTCAGAASTIAAAADFVIMTESAELFLLPPSVLEAKGFSGGTGNALWAAKRGLSHLMSSDAHGCIELAKNLLAYLPSNNLDTVQAACTDDFNRSTEALASLIPGESETPYDIRAAIRELADNGTYFELSNEYARDVTCGFISLAGKTVGVVANDPGEDGGLLTRLGCDKAINFTVKCDAFHIPLLVLCDTAGFELIDSHRSDVLKGFALLQRAFAGATVPKVSLVLRKAYGNGYLAMCSKRTGADIALAYPGAVISVLPPDTLVALRGDESVAASKDPLAARDNLAMEYAEEGSPYEAARRGLIDDIIDPAATRQLLISSFEMLAGKRVAPLPKKYIGLPL